MKISKRIVETGHAQPANTAPTGLVDAVNTQDRLSSC
jgi:hypothetical protein